MINKITFFLATLLISYSSLSQATLFFENFETTFSGWSIAGTNTINSWEQANCSGNGTTLPGDSALYVTQGGINPGCGVNGKDQFTYASAPSGTQELVIFKTVDATCASNLQLDYDYQVNTGDVNDFAEIVYSTDGGTSFVTLGTVPTSAVWTTSNLALPAILDNSSFEIGFRFTFDNANNSGTPIAFDNIKISGPDVTDPVIVCPGGTNTIATNANCDTEIIDFTKYYDVLNDNCTDSSLISVTQLPLESTIVTVPVGNTIQITLIAEDESGNTSQCMFDATVVDVIDPSIICNLTDTNIYVDNMCNATMVDLTSTATVGDNCSTIGNITISQSPLVGAALSGHLVDTPVILTATDEAGNTATCSMNSRTIDTISPTIVCPANQSQFADVTCSDALVDYTTMATVSDNCAPVGSIIVSQSPIAGTPIMDGQIVTLTSNDGNGNNANTCTFSINLIDTIKPSITCPANQTQETDVATCDTNILDYRSMIIWADNCTSNINDVTFIQSPAPDAVISGVTATTITVTDSSGNTQTCTFNVSVIDLESPNIVCPADQDIYTNSGCSATIPDLTSLATTTDNCTAAANIVVTQSPVAGTIISGLNTSTVITLTATDENSNTDQCTFNVINRDTLAPSIVCPSAQTVASNTSCIYTSTDFTGLATATDNCTNSTTIIFSQTPAIGTNFGLGTHSIGLIAEDESGNRDTCYFDLIVEDQTQPTIDACPPTQTVFTDLSCTGTIGDYTGLASASDNCSSPGNITISQSPVAGSIITANTSITITATDEANNVQTCTFTVILSDNIDPIITTCANDSIVDSGGSCMFTIPDLTSFVDGTDNCSDMANMTVTQSPLAGTTGNGATTITLTLSDENGNTTTCVATARPNDMTPASITCPANATINNGSSCDYNVTDYTSIAVVSDNCIGFTVEQSPAPGSLISTGNQEILLTVTDAGANETTCSFYLDIIENIDPTITCPANISSCDPIATYVAPVGNDNCLNFIVTQTDLSGFTSGNTFPVGTTPQTYTVTDSSGNTASCSFTVEVLDYPSEANIVLNDSSLCDETNLLLMADAATSGTGEWFVETGTAILNNQFANNTGANNLQYGLNTFIWKISSASCGETADTINVTVFEEPLPASTIDTAYNCLGTSIDLSATPPNVGTGIWTSNDGLVFTPSNLENTTATNLTSGWNTATWTISNGNCPATSDSIKIFSGIAAEIISPTMDSTICVGDYLIELTGTELSSDFESLWYITNGAGYIADPASSITELSNLSAGENTIIYYSTHPVCGVSADTIIITAELCGDYAPIIPTVITPNLDGKNDLFVIEYLDILYPEATVTIVNRWGGKVFESDGYPEPWDGTFKGEPCQMGAYFYSIKLNNAENKEFNGTISIIR